MTLLARLLKTELIALTVLVLLAAFIAAYMSYESYRHPFQLFSGTTATGVGFFATLALGCIPALLLGAPTHAWLAHRGILRWHISMMLGLAFGALCFLVSAEIGLLGMLFGVMVALVTHWVVLLCLNSGAERPLTARGLDRVKGR